MLDKYPPYGVFKVVAVGDGAVGKTTLLIRYTSGDYPNDYIPTVFDNHNISVKVEDKTYSIGLWDTAGPEGKLRPLSYPGTSLFLVNFSCVSEASFFNVVTKWLPEIRHHCPDTPVALVNTKIDYRTDSILNKEFILKYEEKPITFEQGELMAKKMGCATYIETSSKTGYGIDDLSSVILRTIAVTRDDNYCSKVRPQKKCLVQ
ncbi:rho family small GTPase [Naegleria gruberi]|uniref:Rho family small GTPase n=1 Tax=Naegleria gruberi TaxID=5762 RepID=D2VDD3_NAEGR|nr:rho family small GTPase [Naegleria gruberi]EFC45211.1 rho family small GTPase [Naegleria gruberi]|eukprot:XP_002677955.1 rho family small GTPase [Naegleria gruberi strain NEG-M]